MNLTTFVNAAKEVDPSEWDELILDYVEAWHNGSGEGIELNEYLGFSPSSYSQWVMKPELLESIVRAEWWAQSAFAKAKVEED